MNVSDALDIMWRAQAEGIHFPDALKGKLSLEEAYQVQLAMLARREEQGERQAGWKVGLTADPVRAMFKADAPVFGYLLESGAREPGPPVPWAAMRAPCIESELCFTMGAALSGPGATRAQARGAVSAVAPAYELLERRGDMAGDLPLGVADNVLQIGFVQGTPVRPYPADLKLGDIHAVITCDGAVFKDCIAAEVIDDQLDSIAWLANALAPFGRTLQPGQRIMSGSFYPPAPVEPGQRWHTAFSGVGEIELTFG